MGFFSWLFKSDDGTLQDYIEVLSEEMAKLNASKFAIQKCVGIIGNAIAKSEIIIQGKQGLRYDENYYRLNISPNENDHGTEFWSRVARKLLLEQECLIVPVRGMYFIADAWTESDDVIRPREYSHVTISAAGKTTSLNKRFKSGDVIHIRLPMPARRLEYFKSVSALYDKAVTMASQVYGLSHVPKWGVTLSTTARLVEKAEDGTQKQLTGSEYVRRIQKILTSDDIGMIVLPDGVDLKQIQAEAGDTSSDSLNQAIKASEEACARAFDIPVSVYFGTIQDRSDATNELITYAVGPVAEAINDALNSALVGKDDYINRNERVMVFMARFKHVDIIDSADKLSKMRGDGWTLDEIFHLIGYPEMHTDFTTTRALTKNYSTTDNASDGSAGSSESGSGPSSRKTPDEGPEKGDKAR